MGAGRVAGLAGEHLPARAVGGGRVGDHPPARRPDRFVGVVGVVGDLAHRLLGAAGPEAAVEQARAAAGWRRRAGAGTPSRARGPSASPRGRGRSGRRGRRGRRPALSSTSSSQGRPISSSSPSSQSSIRCECQRQGEVTWGVKPLSARSSQRSAEVAVADRGARHLARQAQQEGLVDRAGDRLRVEPPVPAAQPLDRAASRAGRAGFSRPSRRAASSPGSERLSDCIASKLVEVVLVALAQQLLDPLARGSRRATRW